MNEFLKLKVVENNKLSQRETLAANKSLFT